MYSKIKDNIWTIFFVPACIGAVISICLNIWLLLGNTMPTGFMALHIGIFVVWLPAVLRVKQNQPENEKMTFKTLFRFTPWWMRILAIAGWIYATATVLMESNLFGNAAQKSDNDSNLIFCAAWAMFYTLAASILYPSKAENEPDTK